MLPVIRHSCVTSRVKLPNIMRVVIFGDEIYQGLILIKNQGEGFA